MKTKQAELEFAALDHVTVEGYTPLDIGRFIFMHNRKVYRFTVKSKKTTVALYKLVELAEKANATILYGTYMALPSNNESASACAFIDFTDAKLTPQKVAKQMEKLEFVRSVKINAPTKYGVIADTSSFPLTVGNERVIILRKSIYENMITNARERFGTAGEAFLYYTGYDIGRTALQEYMRFITSKDVTTLIEMAKILTINMGWAIPEIVEIDFKKKTAVIRLHKSFECEPKQNQKTQPYSQFLRGAIAGIATKILNKQVTVEERKCIVKGDPYCEFHVK
jgi:predicted hydrocarbon binding protein